MPHAGVSDSFTASDVRGGGSRVPLGLLASFLFSTPDRHSGARHRGPLDATGDEPGLPAAQHCAYLRRKCRARGFARFDTIRTVIFLIAGKLDFSGVNPHAR
jgi:hypothetical protein